MCVLCVVWCVCVVCGVVRVCGVCGVCVCALVRVTHRRRHCDDHARTLERAVLSTDDTRVFSLFNAHNWMIKKLLQISIGKRVRLAECVRVWVVISDMGSVETRVFICTGTVCACTCVCALVVGWGALVQNTSWRAVCPRTTSALGSCPASLRPLACTYACFVCACV